MSSGEYSASVECVKLSELNANLARLPNTRKEIVKGATLMRIAGWLQTDARLLHHNLVLLYSLEEPGTCVYKALVDITLVKSALNLNDLNLKHDLVEFLGYKTADGQRSCEQLVAHGLQLAEHLESWPVGPSCLLHADDLDLYPKFKAVFHRCLKRASLSAYYGAIDVQRAYMARN